MILCGVSAPGQNKAAGVSLNHRALLIVQDVFDQATRCLLDVRVFLRESTKEGTCKKNHVLFSHTSGVGW